MQTRRATMQTRSRLFRVRIVAVAMVLAITGAACGDDDDTAAAAGGGAAGADDGADWPDKLVFAAVPSEQNERLQESYQASIDILKAELGVEIEFFQAADYAGVIEAMISEKVDIAQFGPFSYVIAKANGAEIEPLAAMIEEEGGEPGYQSYAITQSDNAEIESLEDFAGRKVCFVDPGSTSGFLYPSAGLLDVGIDPESGVEGIFAGGHDASAISVANGECEAGFAFDNMVERELIESGDLEAGQLKIVWKSEVIAGSPVAVRTSLPESLVEAIRTAFLESINIDHAVESGVCASPDDCSFSDEGNYGYKAVDDTFYDGVRAVCEITKSAKCEGVS